MGLEGWLGWSAHLGGVLCRNHTLLLLPASRKWLLVLTFFYLLVRHFPDCACVQLFSVPYSMVVFHCSKTRCLSRCKHFGKGSQVPAYLTCGPGLIQYHIQSNIVHLCCGNPISSNYSLYAYIRAQLCPTLCNALDCSPPGSSVHG